MTSQSDTYLISDNTHSYTYVPFIYYTLHTHVYYIYKHTSMQYYKIVSSLYKGFTVKPLRGVGLS